MTERAGSLSLGALAFDAYGTLFDVHSVIAACEAAFPSHGEALSRLWRAKQLEYTWLLSLMDRYEDFWAVTEKALRYACQQLGLSCDQPPKRACWRATTTWRRIPRCRPRSLAWRSIARW